MASYRYSPGTNLVQLKIDGTVSRVQFEEIAYGIREFVALSDSIHLAVTVTGNEAMNPVVFWNDLKSALRFLPGQARVALITDDRWRRWLEMSNKIMAPCPVGLFNHDDSKAAHDWLASGRDDQAAA